MMNLVKNKPFWVGLALAALMAATRGHHFAALTHLPSASLAVFFAASFYLRRSWVFAALLAEAVVLDYAAITVGGVSSFCVTPAYAFLLPAYGSVWLAGRWLANRDTSTWSALLPFAGSVLVSSFVSELFSSGGFYFFGGRYTNPTMIEFGERLMKYYPNMLSAFAFWIGIIATIHITLALVRTSAQHRA